MDFLLRLLVFYRQNGWAGGSAITHTEGGAMFAAMLVVAGVAAGDGGMRTGEDIAPVVVRLFDRDWEGTWENVWWTDDPSRADLRSGVLRVFDCVGSVQLTGRISIDGEGTVRIRDAWGRSILGIYKIEGRYLVICIPWLVDQPRPTRFEAKGDTHLMTLQPVPNKK
jgi:hypothetical protein